MGVSTQFAHPHVETVKSISRRVCRRAFAMKRKRPRRIHFTVHICVFCKTWLSPVFLTFVNDVHLNQLPKRLAWTLTHFRFKPRFICCIKFLCSFIHHRCFLPKSHLMAIVFDVSWCQLALPRRGFPNFAFFIDTVSITFQSEFFLKRNVSTS